MDFSLAKTFIIEKLVKELPDNLFYHGAHHTFDVVKSAQFIGKQEGISNLDMHLLLTAAYFHDAGFLERYHSNEEVAVTLMEAQLPGFDYTEEELKIISDIVLSTKIDRRPNTLLQQIMCDADHDYFGRKDYYQIAENLRRELEEYGTTYSDLEWLEVQIYFLSEKHRYYTATSLQIRQPEKLMRIEELKKALAAKK